MPDTTKLTESPEIVEQPGADQVTQGLLERVEPRKELAAPHPVIEEARTRGTDTKAMRWFEVEPSPEAEEKIETKTEVKRETKQAHWYEGYRPGYFC